ncbi:MAG TPA: pentapeptide repeat-containing protein [Streptosporangiaceae bacterium]|nr:pentapeptide repeat-containing protein [Streptosporangiaceae bacterium]
MAASTRRSAGRRGVANPEPSEPDLPAELTVAGLAEADLDDGAVHYGLDVADLDLCDRESANLEIDQSRYTAVNFSGVRLRRGMIRDAVFDRCDLANLRARETSMLRTRLVGCRMTGLSVLAGTIRDVTFSGSRMDLVSFSNTKFGAVVFTECRLDQANFGDADLSGVRFVDCDLTGAQFSGATLTGTRFTGCDLTGISGITSMRGAIITSSDAFTLARIFASALGIEIEDESS